MAFHQKSFFKLMEHDLEVADVLNTQIGHMLLELSLLKINLVFELNDALSKS